MTIAKNIGRQQEIVAYVDIHLADLVTAVAKDAIELPKGAVVSGGDLVVSEAFNSTSSDAIIIGDSGDTDRYLGSTSVRSLARTALVPTGYEYTAKTMVSVTWTSGGGTPTTGIARLCVKYYVVGRSQFSAGKSERSDGTLA